MSASNGFGNPCCQIKLGLLQRNFSVMDMDNYSPIGNSKNKNDVIFCEARPPEYLWPIVHRYIKIWTEKPLSCDYRFDALPDGCTYMIFDQLRPDVVGASTIRGESMDFNLGKMFHYVNIRFFPGVWKTDLAEPFVGQIDQPYNGKLPLVATNQALLGQSFKRQQESLTRLVEDMMNQGILAASVIVTSILKNIDSINSVAEMAQAAGVSSRHLQRRLKQEVGFTPHDFLKIIRLQRSLSGSDLDQYSDQAHFIRSFRSMTGRTPSKFHEEFDV